MAVYRLRKLWPEYKDRIRIHFRSLSLELKNLQPTPKQIVEQENLLMARQEPDLPMSPWTRPEFQYVPTLLPAFEAEKAAAEQGEDVAWEFAWQVRKAFFADNRTICMRHVLGQIAAETELDVDRFLADWDSGRFRAEVIAESHRGWEEIGVRGSPTFILPSGEQVWNPGAVSVEWNRGRVKSTTPAECPEGDCLRLYRDMLDSVASGQVSEHGG